MKRHDDDRGGKWQVQLADWLGSLGIPPAMQNMSPWSNQSTFKGTPRVLSLIDAVVWEKLGKHATRMPRIEKAEKLIDIYVDISQNHIRRPFTNSSGITGTMTTGSQFFSYDRDSLVTPYEQLLWHGHSRTLTVPENIKASSLKALAGEGMSLPCLGTVLWSGLIARILPDS